MSVFFSDISERVDFLIGDLKTRTVESERTARQLVSEALVSISCHVLRFRLYCMRARTFADIIDAQDDLVKSISEIRQTDAESIDMSHAKLIGESGAILFVELIECLLRLSEICSLKRFYEKSFFYAFLALRITDSSLGGLLLPPELSLSFPIVQMDTAQLKESASLAFTQMAAASRGLGWPPQMTAVLCGRVLEVHLHMEICSSRTDWASEATTLASCFANHGLFWTAEYLQHSVLSLGDKFKDDEIRAKAMINLGLFYKGKLEFAAKLVDREKKEWLEALDKMRKDSGWQDWINMEISQKFTDSDDGWEVTGNLLPGTISVSPNQLLIRQEQVTSDASQFELKFPGFSIIPTVNISSLHNLTIKRIKAVNNDLVESSGNGKESVDHFLSAFGDRTLSSARELFRLSLHFFTQAQGIFNLESHCGEHLFIARNICNLYNTLALCDIGREVAFCQRKMSVLDPLISAINPKVYVDEFRDMTMEMGECCELVYLTKKNDDFAHNAITYYRMFVDSFIPPGKDGPLKPEAEITRNFLPLVTRAVAKIAKLEAREGGEKTEENSRCKRALQTYEWLFRFVEFRPDLSELSNELLTACKEHYSLLRVRQRQIRG